MDRFSPRAILLILLVVALAIFAGGAYLARTVELIRVERDRGPLRAFATAVQTELGRLDQLYERRLRQLGQDADLRSSDNFALRKECDRVAGITQVCILQRNPGARADLRFDVESSSSRPPLFTFYSQTDAFPGPQFVLPAMEVFDQESAHGWIDEPGSPLLFWFRKNSESAVVFLVNRAEVAAALDRWLAGWAPKPFSSVQAAEGPDRLLGSREQTLIAAGAAGAAHPDLLLSLEDRFGAWQLASWDRVEQRVHYSLPALAACAGLAVFVGVLALLVSQQQRRALHLAAQRVSFVNRVSHEVAFAADEYILLQRGLGRRNHGRSFRGRDGAARARPGRSTPARPAHRQRAELFAPGAVPVAGRGAALFAIERARRRAGSIQTRLSPPRPGSPPLGRHRPALSFGWRRLGANPGQPFFQCRKIRARRRRKRDLQPPGRSPDHRRGRYGTRHSGR